MSLDIPRPMRVDQAGMCSSPGSLSVLISTVFSVKVAFSFLQLKHSTSVQCKKCLSSRLSVPQPLLYLYLISVESLAKEDAALDISVSTMGLTTWE